MTIQCFKCGRIARRAESRRLDAKPHTICEACHDPERCSKCTGSSYVGALYAHRGSGTRASRRAAMGRTAVL